MMRYVKNCCYREKFGEFENIEVMKNFYSFSLLAVDEDCVKNLVSGKKLS